MAFNGEGGHKTFHAVTAGGTSCEDTVRLGGVDYQAGRFNFKLSKGRVSVKTAMVAFDRERRPFSEDGDNGICWVGMTAVPYGDRWWHGQAQGDSEIGQCGCLRMSEDAHW